MYLQHFGLISTPFSIAPDPRYLFMSERHREALAHLSYGIRSGGFVMLTGEVGTGKTTICRALLARIPDDTDVALILNPNLSAVELLETVCDEFGIGTPGDGASIKRYIDLLNQHLLDAHANNRNSVLIIDEAQNLGPDVLEQMRLLTNLETDERKLLQIVIVGQPELRDMLERADLRQLAQRITARYHLEPLTRQEVADYVAHRLEVAGVHRPLFTPAALDRLYRASGGIPRLVNSMGDRALLGAYVEGRDRVTPRIVSMASREVTGGSARQSGRHAASGPRAGLLVVLLLSLAIAVAYFALPGANRMLDPVSRPTRADAPAPTGPVTVAGGPIEPIAAASPQPVTPSPDTMPAEPVPAPSAAPPLPATEAVVASASSPWPLPGPRPGSRERAYRDLFEAWNLHFDAESALDACQQATFQGVACLPGRGNLGSLRRLNRPAVLVLADARGVKSYVTLIRLNGGEALLAVAGERFQVDIAELDRRWSGVYVLLWSPPPGYTRPTLPPADGPLGRWLADRLGITLDPGDDAMATRLADAVRRFQAEEGLERDGMLGPQTLIRLNTRTRTDIPLLAVVSEVD